MLDFLDGLGIKKGIVTNTQRDLMDLTLKKVKLAERFDFLLSGSDVAVGKPDPEMIHKGCRTVGAAEGESLLIGDTPADIKAGTAAGVKTVGVGVKGDWTIKSIGEFPELFLKLLKA